MFTGTYRRNGEGDYLCSRDEVAAIFRDAGQVTQDNKLMFSMIDIGERAGSGIPGVFSVWHNAFGTVPEYSQRTSPDRITTTLFTQKTTFTTQKTTQEPDNTEEKNGAKVIENTSEVIENVIENTDTVEKNGAKVIENASTVIENVIENTSDVIENAVSLSKNQEAILRIIKDNPSISKAKLALEVGISENSISRNIEAMRGKYLRRVGPDKGGHWEVISKNFD
jgi:ATP-dependent DNA helicase RecG